jgi:thiosulfate/3-mercaptopyruvate sulfurtransferase
MEKYTTLISTEELSQHLHDSEWAIVDCRFALAFPEKGVQDYFDSHIPGAVYAHLEKDLSGSIIPGETGRHPWPGVDQAALFFSRIGIEAGVQVVAYDDAGGALAAVRLWWMLRWLGHETVAVLDGGWQKWVTEGREVKSGIEVRPQRNFISEPRTELLVSTAKVDKLRMDPAYRIFDARAAERYHGLNETIDPVAGHIPGAFSAPYLDNLTIEGVFRPVEELRAHYKALVGGILPEKTIFYCGSGVTSVHDLLAMLHAGLGEAKLYAGSWSEWIAGGKRPVAT